MSSVISFGRVSSAVVCVCAGVCAVCAHANHLPPPLARFGRMNGEFSVVNNTRLCTSSGAWFGV